MTRKKTAQKRVLGVLLMLILAAFVAGVGFASMPAQAAEEAKSLDIIHISDMHVMIEKYCNTYSEKYVADTKTTKMLEETAYVSEAIFEEICALDNAPKYIFVTGDVTSNGEYENHVWIANLLKKVTEKMRKRPGYEGFQIFVNPGNHDMYNCKAKSYMPSEEELNACADKDEREALLASYKTRSVATTTSKQFMDLYADFGYCDCPGRKNGVHASTCGIADGIKVEYFFESEFWYDDVTSRDGDGLEVRTPDSATQKAFEDSDKEYTIINEDARFGACSVICRLPEGYDVLSIDTSCRAYKYKDWQDADAEEAIRTTNGWHETTGGMISDEQLMWAIDALREDIAADKPVFTLGHINFIPHFDSEDEVISLFTYDNWEKATYTLADAGIRYFFSGHQHAADIVTYTTQNGHIAYDIETGSFASYGVSWRTMTLTQGTQKDGSYYEDFSSLVHNLNYAPFVYGVYRLSEESGEQITTDPISDDFTALTDATIMDGNLTLFKKVTTDHYTGEEVGIADFLAVGMYDMAGSVEHGMAGNYVGEKIFDLLDGLTDKVPSVALGALISGLHDVDFCPFSFEGNDYSVGAAPQKGYDLAAFTEDIAEFLVGYDFSFGKVKDKLTLGKALMIIYGGHLAGAHSNVADEEIAPLIEFLQNGGFVDFLVTLLEDALLPQLEILLDLPIRFDASSPVLTDKGFDITAYNTSSSTVDGIIKTVASLKVLFKNTDKNGYSSLRCLLRDVNDFAGGILLSGTKEQFSLFKTFSESLYETIAEYFDTIQHYYKKALEPLEKVLDGEPLRETIDDALVNKYVTDAFCRNLGTYGADILLDFDVDDTYDGSEWVDGDRYMRYPVKNNEIRLTAKNEDGSTAFQGHTYLRDADGKDALSVTPTALNGMLPGLVSVSFGEDVHTDKNIGWFTFVQEDVFNPNDVPDSFVTYWEKDNPSAAVKVKAEKENVMRVLPTIDLGIAFFNMTHSYRRYNRYSVSLVDLKKGTEYAYKLGSDKYGWSDTFRFKTADEGDFEFVAISDIQGSIEQNYIASLADLKKATSSDPAFIASCGDNVDNGKNIMQYTWMLDGQNEVWSNNTFVSVAGNHEDEANALDSIIALPDDAVVTGESGYYYSYDYNAAHFVVLNTNDLDADGYLAEEQTEWLVEDLKNNRKNKQTKWTIVMLHKGPFTAGSHAFDGDVIALREQLPEIFAENGVDLVLQGHDHTYSVSEFILSDGTAAERTGEYKKDCFYKQDGVLYINLGTMGDKYYDYIYHEDVPLVARDKKSLASELTPYYNSVSKNLELTETPVFALVDVTSTTLKIATYTVVDGETVAVDNILLTNVEPTAENESGRTLLWISVGVGAVIAALLVAMIVVLRAASKRKRV